MLDWVTMDKPQAKLILKYLRDVNFKMFAWPGSRITDHDQQRQEEQTPAWKAEAATKLAPEGCPEEEGATTVFSKFPKGFTLSTGGREG